MSNFTQSLLLGKNEYKEIIGKENGKYNFNGVSVLIAEFNAIRFIYRVKGVVVACLHCLNAEHYTIIDAEADKDYDTNKYLRILLNRVFEERGHKISIDTSHVGDNLKQEFIAEGKAQYNGF
jgi:hypothetical protein